MKTAARDRTQLSGIELQQLRWLLGGGLTLLSVATVFYLDVEAWLLVGLTTACVLAGLVWPAGLASIPRWVERLAFPGVAAVFAADLWLSGELLSAMVRLDILLLLYRSMIYRRRRDDLQLVVLGMFLVVVAGVLSVSLMFALHIVAYTGLALVFLLVITLSERNTEPTAKGGEREVPAWARHVEWRRLLRRVRKATDWRVVALGGGLFAGLVVLATLLFLAIPRFQLENGLFLQRFITKKTLTGFSDTIRFGDVTEITQDNRVALTVDVSDRDKIPASPYWRMMVLDEYRDGTFRLSAALRAQVFGPEQGRTELRGRGRPAEDELVRWTFYLESGVSRYLPLPGRFDLLQFRERQSYRFSPTLGVLALRDEPVTMTAYRVENLDTGDRRADRGMAAYLRGETTGPFLSTMRRVGVDETDRAALERFVREIVADDSVPAMAAKRAGGNEVGPAREVLRAEAFARRAEAWLEARHAYSLSPRIPDGPGDPLVRWMASGEGGHCELFAGSFVLLARAAGYPARVATGFRGGSWNGYSNNFTLRNADAHAWCEIFDVADEMWVRADPTPGSGTAGRDETRGEAALAQRTDRSWTARIDSLRVFWYRRIVNFDQQSQLETLKALKETTEQWGRELREMLSGWARAARGWAIMPWDGRRVIAVAAEGLAVCGFIWLMRRAWMRGWTGRGEHRQRGDAVRAEAGRWLVRMRPAREESRGRVDEPHVERVVADLLRLRFGARETWPDATQVFRAARKVRRERGRR